MGDEERPSNIFVFPGAKRNSGGGEDAGFKPGEFLDTYGPSLFVPVEQLPDEVMEEMVVKLKQHRALADFLVRLTEDERERRMRAR